MTCLWIALGALAFIGVTLMFATPESAKTRDGIRKAMDREDERGR